MPTINLDGREMAFRFTIWSARKFRDAYGYPLVETFMSAPGMKTPRIADSVVLTQVVWAGLLPDEPELLVEDAEVMLAKFFEGKGSIKALYKKVREAMEDSGLFGILEKDKPPTKNVKSGG